MFGIAATHGRYNLQACGRLAVWTRDYLHKAAVTDLGRAIVAVFVAVQLRFGGTITGTYGGLRHVDCLQLSGFRLALKELFDRCLAATVPILLAPLMAALAAAGWLSDRGPVLFKHVWVGKDSHAFRIYKLRIMVMDAEPRPALPGEADSYAVRRRLAVKPGLARLRQVKLPIGPVPVLALRSAAH